MNATCAEHYQIERYAYGVQKQYLYEQGSTGPVATSVRGCQ